MGWIGGERVSLGGGGGLGLRRFKAFVAPSAVIHSRTEDEDLPFLEHFEP